MENQMIYSLDCQVQALREELERTRKYIYREYKLSKGITSEMTQSLINEYIKRHKSDGAYYQES